MICFPATLTISYCCSCSQQCERRPHRRWRGHHHRAVPWHCASGLPNWNLLGPVLRCQYPHQYLPTIGGTLLRWPVSKAGKGSKTCARYETLRNTESTEYNTITEPNNVSLTRSALPLALCWNCTRPTLSKCDNIRYF